MLNKIENCNYYTYNEGALSFLYYPLSGKVKCGNSASTYRAVEHFSRRGLEINWSASNVIRNTLYVITPEHLTEEESIAIIGKTKEGLYAQELADKASIRDELLLNNVDNTTGEVLKEEYLKTTSRRIKTDSSKTRDDVCNWFNRFNLELIRPDYPVIILSTKSKGTIIKEGRGLLWQLFEQGRLRKLTKEEYQTKMDNFNMRKRVS